MGTRRSKAALKSFLRFSGSSAICFLLDYGLFTLLNSVLLVSLPDGTRELCATYGARIVSAVTDQVKDGDIILRLEGEDAQKPEGYVPVEDEGIAQAVYDIFHLKNMSSFDFRTYLEGD